MASKRGARRLVFISYRRADADAMAGRIKDRLTGDLSGWEVFMDVESIDAGANFRQAIDETLARSEVVIALIGPRWMGEGGVRIRDPQDLVRYEIKSALSRALRIIPVLVNDARMPAAADLPEEIAPLHECNAVELRHARFDDDFAHLVAAITGEKRPVRRKPLNVARLAANAVLGALIAMAVTLAALMIHNAATGASADQRIGELGAALLFPISALVGALIGVWRASRK